MSEDEQTPETGDDVTTTDTSGDGSAAADTPVTAPRRPVRPAASAASRARRIGGSAVRAPASAAAGVPTATGDRSERGTDSTPAEGSDAKSTRKPVSTDKAPKGTASAATVADADGDGDSGGKWSRFRRKRAEDRPRTGATRERGGKTRRRWDSRAALRWLPAGVLSAAAIAMVVVLIVVITGGRWDRPASSTVRDKVLSAAKTCLVATNTYKYTALDAFEKKGLACTGSASAAEFKQSVEKLLKKIAPTVKQSQTFQVNSAGIIDVTDDNQWDVLVYGQVSVVNVSTKGRVDPYGALLRMQKVDGQWRMVRLDTLCSSTLITSGNKCT